MRLVVKTYKYKLYNSKKNRYLVRQIELASEIWNFCIAMRRMYYLVYGKKLKANDLKKYIAKIGKRRKWSGPCSGPYGIRCSSCGRHA